MDNVKQTIRIIKNTLFPPQLPPLTQLPFIPPSVTHLYIPDTRLSMPLIRQEGESRETFKARLAYVLEKQIKIDSLFSTNQGNHPI